LEGLANVGIGVDIVAKVENRTPQKMSRKSIFWTSLLLRQFVTPLRKSVIDFG